MRATTEVRRGPRRVLYVEHNMDGTVGGSHHCLLDICRNIDRSRYEPVVLFFQDNPLTGAFRKLDLDVRLGSPARPLLQLSGSSGSLATVARNIVQTATNAALMLVVRPLQWIGFLRRHRIDLVHLNNTFNGDHDLILAAWLLRIPCVAHQRGYAGETGPLAHWFARRLERIIAISGYIRDDLRRRGLPDRLIVLIHDGIDPGRVVVHREPSALRRELGFGDSEPVIGMVGNLKPWKGQHVFVDAFAQVASRHPAARGLIVGAHADPGYVEQLRRTLDRHGLGARVVFAGYQSHPIDYMAAMNVVVHASVEPEPFGIVITEAMALGKPVIASAHGGPLDIVEDGVTGFLTEPGEPAALARRVVDLLGSPAVAARLGEAARRRFRVMFTIEANVGRLTDLYEGL